MTWQRESAAARPAATAANDVDRPPAERIAGAARASTTSRSPARDSRVRQRSATDRLPRGSTRISTGVRCRIAEARCRSGVSRSHWFTHGMPRRAAREAARPARVYIHAAAGDLVADANRRAAQPRQQRCRAGRRESRSPRRMLPIAGGGRAPRIRRRGPATARCDDRRRQCADCAATIGAAAGSTR